MKKFLFVLGLLAVLCLPFSVSHAQLSAGLGKLDEANQTTGLSKADLGDTIGGIIKIVLSLMGTIFLILIIYAGILWMTARGAEEQITKSKDIIRAAIIGLAIVLSAYAITYFVGSRLSGTASSGNQGAVANGCGGKVLGDTCYADTGEKGVCDGDMNGGALICNIISQ